MSDSLTLRLARPEEAERVIGFINENFDWKLPLVNLPEYFNFYYRSGDALQYALAEENGELLAVAGYIRANESPTPDIWVSVWVAKKGHNGVGLDLMNALPELTGASVVACNNIRPKTMAFYRFLGWHADRVPHFYRLSGQESYSLARVKDPTVLPVGGDLTLEQVVLSSQDMLLLPGGKGGVESMQMDLFALALIQKAHTVGCYLAAICAAPTLLAHLGLLDRRSAVCYPGMEGEMGSAVVRPECPVVVDGRIITARSAGCAFDFALKLIEILAGAEKAKEVQHAIHYRGTEETTA